MRDHLPDDVAEEPRLTGKAREGLHHHHIGKRILRAAGQLRMERFHLALRAFRAANDKGGKAAENHHQANQQKPQAPIQNKREWQQHNGGDEGCQMLSEKRQPKPEQVIGAHQHDLHQPARLRIPMKGERQGQHMLEIIMHDFQAIAMRHAVREQRHRDIGTNGRKPNRAPDDQQRQSFRPNGRFLHPV